jgi:hypothetical protein
MRLLHTRLLYLKERRRLLCTRVFCLSTKGDACCVHASPLSRLKKMHVVNLRLLYLDERVIFWAHRPVLVTTFYAAHYIVGILVTDIANEACYSLLAYL